MWVFTIGSFIRPKEAIQIFNNLDYFERLQNAQQTQVKQIYTKSWEQLDINQKRGIVLLVPTEQVIGNYGLVRINQKAIKYWQQNTTI